MSSVITLDFEKWKAQQVAAGQPVVLDEFVFANVPNLDPAKTFSRDEKLPAASQIVHRQAVNKTGLASVNAVAYSVTLGTEVGNFDFNWIGLMNKASGVIGMITHAPSQKKIKTANGLQGNVLTRSFLLEFEGAATETAITTTAETWQIDFTARLTGMDEMQRLINIDSYGEAAFFDDGFAVVRQGEQYVVKKGLAYVGGLRGELAFDQTLNSLRNTRVYADFSYQGNLVSQWKTVVKITAANELKNSLDTAGNPHYVFAVAQIDGNGNVVDLRPRGALSDRSMNALEKQLQSKLNQKIDKISITNQLGSQRELIPSQDLLTKELATKATKAELITKMNRGEGGWMQDKGVSLNDTPLLSGYRVNSIGYTYGNVSSDTYQKENHLFMNLFGYYTNEYGAQLALTLGGSFGYRIIRPGGVDDWITLATKNYVDNELTHQANENKNEFSKKVDKAVITQQLGNQRELIPSQDLLTIELGKKATKADLNTKMNQGAGGWMQERGISLSNTPRLSDYRLNSIGYAYANVSSDTFLNRHHVFMNLFGYSSREYGAQLAVSLENEGEAGFRVIKPNNVGDWQELAKKSDVVNLSGSLLGVGQTWVNVIGGRSLAVLYRNTTGKPIMVSARGMSLVVDGQMSMSGSVNGVMVAIQSVYALNTHANVTFIVPNGAEYRVDGANLVGWAELR